MGQSEFKLDMPNSKVYTFLPELYIGFNSLKNCLLSETVICKYKKMYMGNQAFLKLNFTTIKLT